MRKLRKGRSFPTSPPIRRSPGLYEQGTKPADVEEVETAEESVETDDPEDVTEVQDEDQDEE